MSSKYITQSALAAYVNCKQPYIAKLKKKGVFDHCMDGKKIIRDKAVQAYYDNEDPRREAQRIANEQKRTGDEVDETQTIDLKKNNLYGMFDVSYLGKEAQQELNELVETGKSSVHKIQIKDAFIESKKKENEFKKELGVLIELEEAEALIELVASNMKTKMYNVSHLFKSKYPKTTRLQVKHLYMLIDDAFNEFHKFGIENDE